jgi:hypothetical protein
MASGKLLNDIRYFETDEPNLDGCNPQDLGKLLKLPKSHVFTGARIARKSRQLGLTIADKFDHVYINFTSAEEPGSIRFASRSVDREDAWLRYVDVGVSFSKINQMTEVKKQYWLESITLDVMRLVVARSPNQLAIIDEVESLVREFGEELPIVHQIKETKSYSVAVFYRIAPEMKKSTAWIKYHDKSSGLKRVGCFAKLQFYEDIMFLVSGISVSKGFIKLSPRPSYKARLYNQRYKVPIEVDIESLPICS